MTPNTAPPSPASNTAAPPSPATHAADLSLQEKIVLLERKVDAITELVRCRMTGEELPSATEAPPDVTLEVPEASTLETLA